MSPPSISSKYQQFITKMLLEILEKSPGVTF